MRAEIVKRVKVASVAAGGLLVAFVAVGGFLHTPAGRPLLAKLGVGCPMKAPPVAVERARLESAHAERGDTDSPARPALGFTLDHATLTEVTAWAETNHVDCNAMDRNTVLTCTHVPAAAVSETTETHAFDQVMFGFAPSGKLVNVVATRSEAAVDAASDMQNATSRLRDVLGEPKIAANPMTAEFLGGGSYRTAVVGYRFHDYFADVTSTALPGRGVMLREHFMSVTD